MSPTTRRTMRLRYCDVLLHLLRREIGRASVGRPIDWPSINELCDRFERVLATFTHEPLVWDGDYA